MAWKSKATTKKELMKILDLVDATSDDVFCDLGCGHGKLCMWASKKVKFVIGTEDDRKRYREAIRNVKKSGCKNIKIINDDYRYVKTLNRLKKGTIFYCTNNEGFGFFKKMEDTIKPKTKFVSYYLPPYPIKPEIHDDWICVMTTPFKISKNKREWIHSLGKNYSLTKLERKIRKDFPDDYDERILELNDDIEGFEWAFKKRK